MSFYDDASLVFLPSGQAGKDGKAYSMKPVPEYGSELVTNGGFDTDSDWIKGTGWNISGGTANCDGTQTSTSQLRTSVGLSIQNTPVRFSFEVKNYSLGTLTATIEGTGGNEFSGINSNGIYTIEATSSDSTPRIAFNADSSFVGSIDNVSVKEVIVDGDFDFSRGSNLTATRVDSNGLIEKGRENLLKQSNNFGDTAWVQSQTTRSSGEEGYDGSSDAWEIVRASGGGLALYQMITNNSGVNTALSGVNTFSIYVKVNSSNGIGLAFASTSVMAQFDISDNSKTSAVVENGIIASTQEYVGNNFYRLSVTADTTASNVRLYTLSANGASVSVSGATYIIQDAQTEIGLVATEVIESGASTGLAGILEDSPRFDYSGGASCPSLLLEGGRTNLIGQSEYYNDWDIKTNIGFQVNEGISPEGLQNAQNIYPTSTGACFMYENVSYTSGETYVYSVFAKSNGKDYLQITTSGSSFGTDYCTFDLSNGTIDNNGFTNADIEDYGNGWYRCYIVVSAIATSSSRIVIGLVPSATSSRLEEITANGTDGVLIYGVFNEQGSYPTSYIPNHSGGSVTREADVCEGAGTSSTFNADEGVFYAEISTNTDDTDKAISLNNAVSGSLNNRLWMGYSTPNKRIYALGYVNNSLQFALSKLMTDESLFVKIACRYKRNDIAFFVNGEKVGTDTTALNFTELSSLDFNIGTAVSGAAPLYGNVKQVLVFNSYLSDSEIITLTS